MRQHWIDKLRAGADSIDKLIQGGSWPKHAHEAVLTRIFDTDANNLRCLAALLEVPPVGKVGVPCKDCQGDGYREGSGYPCATCNATGEVSPAQGLGKLLPSEDEVRARINASTGVPMDMLVGREPCGLGHAFPVDPDCTCPEGQRSSTCNKHGLGAL